MYLAPNLGTEPQDMYGSSIEEITLVTCEEDPKTWDLWDDLPPTEPIRSMLLKPEFPIIGPIDIWIPPPPPELNETTN